MELYQRFDQMLSFCDETTMPPYARERLKTHLQYFRAQSLSDVDRRDSINSIHWNWESFKMQRNAVDVIAHFAKDSRFWNPVAEFVADKALEATGDLAVPAVGPLTLPAFFVRLVREVHKTFLGHEPVDKAFAVLGLKYLHLESLREPSDRDHAYIRKIWHSVWRTLDRDGFLEKYRKNQELTRKLKNFVSGHDALEQTPPIPPSAPKTKDLSATPANVKPFRAPFKGKIRIGDPDHDYSGRQGINMRNVGEEPSS